MIWADFQAAEPDLARQGWKCLERRGVALLGTLRRDGSPRISPVWSRSSLEDICSSA